MQFDHEKLDVYHLEVQFIAWVTPLISDVRERYGKLVTEACDHLDRASLSALFNTAEGNGKGQRQTRAKFFDDARGSGIECAACLDALVAKRACTPAQIQPGKELLVRIVSILTKLVAKFEDTGDALREESGDYYVDTEAD
jgi:four helix bundle protein